MYHLELPEPPLEPPTPDLRIAFKCQICDEPIYEGEDYYDIPIVGKCCAGCIDDCKHYDAEVDDNSDALYEEARDRRLFDE